MTDVAEARECQQCLARAQKRHVRIWRGLASLDLTKPPAPVLRWAGIVLIGIIYAAIGAPTRLGDRLWAAIIGGALLFPDSAGLLAKPAASPALPPSLSGAPELRSR